MLESRGDLPRTSGSALELITATQTHTRGIRMLWCVTFVTTSDCVFPLQSEIELPITSP
jgi:hypothetical protein